MELKTRLKMMSELAKKLEVLKMELLSKGEASVKREFFWVAEPRGSDRGTTTFKTIDLAQEFPDKITDFMDKLNAASVKTSEGYIFATAGR